VSELGTTMSKSALLTLPPCSTAVVILWILDLPAQESWKMMSTEDIARRNRRYGSIAGSL